MIRKLSEGFTPKHYLVEILFGLTALFGFYLIIAWSSYSPIDATWSVSSDQPEVINKAGWLGAWVIDLLFVFFGKVANILPFLFCIAPIYFIRTKRVDSLTWTRFGLRMLGFIILMLGLTALCSLVLSNDSYHLSGGVLGGSLVKHLYPSLGKFGISIFSVAFSIIGFILCSGKSLIHLVVKFYNWLTVQNEPESVEQADPSEQIVEDCSQAEVEMPTAPWQQTLDNQNEIVINEPISSDDYHNDVEQSSYFDDEADDVTKLGDYQVKQDDILPTVSIDDVALPNNDWQQENESFEDESAVNFDDDFSDSEMPKVHIPEVKLSPAKPVEPLETEDEDYQHLATQFAQREAEREKVAQEQNIAVHIAEPNIAVDEDTTDSESADEKPQGLRPIGIDQLVELFGDHKPTSKPTTEMPSLDLLSLPPIQQQAPKQNIAETAHNIEQKLLDFKIKASVKDVLEGPVVTRYELELQPGVKAARVTSVDTDLARALKFKSIRVAETIPGKSYIGIETPNATRQTVYLREVLDSAEFKNSTALLPMALGKDISGKAVVIDLAKTPHLLVAGSTGSGKSVGINTMILSLLYRVKPEQVKFIMIDPKVVELSVYNGIPHLLTEVVTDMKKAANALNWCVDEMERRYQLLAKLRVRNIEGYNEYIEKYRAEGYIIQDPLWKPSDTMDSSAPALECLSYIVLIVDEFADLMMVAGKQIEEKIARLTQKARAVGIHVILATQRPSVDVITGLIKSNIPSRIAFTVVQRNDSRTILDQNGAEALLGRGDMLYLANGTTELIRVHGAFMTDDEVNRVADDWRARGKPNYIEAILEDQDDSDDNGGDDYGSGSEELDPLFDEIVEFVCHTGNSSVSSVQRRFKIGFNRAARIMDQLEEQGIVSAMRNGKREVLARNSNSDF